jgi:hypothetical protein
MLPDGNRIHRICRRLRHDGWRDVSRQIVKHYYSLALIKLKQSQAHQATQVNFIHFFNYDIWNFK